MRAYIELKSHLAGFTAKPAIFSVGGHGFKYGEKLVQFDWDSTSAGAELGADGRITIKAELREFNDDVYSEDWKAQGLDRQAVERLLLNPNQLTDIDEVFYECYEDSEETKPILLEVTRFLILTDSADSEVPADLLKHYNSKHIEEQTR